MPLYNKNSILLLALLLFVAGCVSTDASNRQYMRGPRGGHLIQVGEAETSAYSSINALVLSRVPGVRRAPDGNGIVVRASQSVTGSRQPLYVIDGVPSTTDAEGLSLYDIRDIEVVTATSSTASFGMRGANGVIVIRTRTGDD